MLLNFKYFCTSCPVDDTNRVYPAKTSLEELEDIIKNNHQVSIKYNSKCSGCRLLAVMVKNITGIVYDEHKKYCGKDNLITVINNIYEEVFGYFIIHIQDAPRKNKKIIDNCIITRTSTTIENRGLKSHKTIVTKDEFLNTIKAGTLLWFCLYFNDIDEVNDYYNKPIYDYNDFLKDKDNFEESINYKSLQLDLIKYNICMVKGATVTKPAVK